MIYLRNKVYTGYKIIDDSSIKYYLKEIVLTLLSLFLIYSIFSYGRNYVITNSPSYVLYNNWHINLPKGTEVLTQYKNTNWFGEGTKVFVIRVDKQETTDTPIFDTCNNQKGSNPFYNLGFRAFIYARKCGYFSSFFIFVKIFFIFLFDTISKSVLKPEISCNASVRSVLS